jgi:acyl-CoA reductase-like NAD-dependent aldehyde dehydrogenase
MTKISTPTEIGCSIQELCSGAHRWIALSPAQRISLLVELRAAVYARSAEWADASAAAKGVAATPHAGEEWISGPWALIYALNRYIDSLRQIARHGGPKIDQKRVRTRGDGQVVVDVFPAGFYDALLLNGVRAEVWMQPDVTRETLPQTMGVWYREPTHAPHIVLLLAPGNIASTAPLDVLYKLLAEGAVCILKMNPVNAYLGPIFEEALKPLVDGRFLRFAYGGSDVGEYLCACPAIDEIHITGSAKTFDTIVFGDDLAAAIRKANDDPVLKKPITSELGNVSPTIVIGGDWSNADYRYQAEQIVTQKLHNAGFNCNASQVLILPSDWDGTPKLLAAIQQILRDAIDRPAYYPGSAKRYAALTAGRDDIRAYGPSSEAFVPRTLVHAKASDMSDPAFSTEAFCSVLAWTTLPGDTDMFMKRAVDFSNEALWGTLGANVVIHPKTIKRHANSLDDAVARLRYGCISVNTWTGVGFILTEIPWGAYPGHARNDIGSGSGIVHNSHLFSRSQKSVVRAPFAPFPRSLAGYGSALLPKPPWFITHRMAAETGKALIDFEMRKTLVNAAKVGILAMRG